MDFDLTQEQRAIQEAARSFAEREFTRDLAMSSDRERVFPTGAYRRACAEGLIGVHFPKEYGGRGLGVLEHVLVVEAMSSVDPGLGVAMSLRPFGSEIILKFASDEIRRKYLPGILSGDVVPGAAFTEPDHGSDVSDLDTTAVREGDQFVINGRKTFITNGLDANVMTVLCKTDPSAVPTYRGLTMILVDTADPGFQAEDLGNKMGQRMLHTTRIALKDIRVPASRIVGKENRGFYQMLEFFDEARLAIAAQALGGAQAAFDRAVRHVKNRRQFGKRLADLQVTQHKVADMATSIEAARLLTYQAAWTADNRSVSPMLTSMAKSYAASVATKVAEEAIQLMGGYGYFEDGEVERIYRDVRVLEIYEGTREIQKNTIANYLLGKDG